MKRLLSIIAVPSIPSTTVVSAFHRQVIINDLYEFSQELLFENVSVTLNVSVSFLYYSYLIISNIYEAF